jgi:hypothetical protein
LGEEALFGTNYSISKKGLTDLFERINWMITNNYTEKGFQLGEEKINKFRHVGQLIEPIKFHIDLKSRIRPTDLLGIPILNA